MKALFTYATGKALTALILSTFISGVFMQAIAGDKKSVYDFTMKNIDGKEKIKAS
ncbi:MAG: hypothetical protein AAB209_09600 [Bacteroidota bacterium]